MRICTVARRPASAALVSTREISAITCWASHRVKRFGMAAAVSGARLQLPGAAKYTGSHIDLRSPLSRKQTLRGPFSCLPD